jgi:GNAT superfamily N-acetyltransferase
MITLTAGDAPALAALFAAQRSEYLAHFHPFAFDATSLSSMFANVKRDQFWALRTEDGVLAGFSMLRGWDEGYERPAFGVFVAEAFAGRGLARKALAHAIEWCALNSVSSMMLKVAPTNVKARQIYVDAGFQSVGLCPNTGHEIMEKYIAMNP